MNDMLMDQLAVIDDDLELMPILEGGHPEELVGSLAHRSCLPIGRLEQALHQHLRVLNGVKVDKLRHRHVFHRVLAGGDLWDDVD